MQRLCVQRLCMTACMGGLFPALLDPLTSSQLPDTSRPLLGRYSTHRTAAACDPITCSCTPGNEILQAKGQDQRLVRRTYVCAAAAGITIAV